MGHETGFVVKWPWQENFTTQLYFYLPIFNNSRSGLPPEGVRKTDRANNNHSNIFQNLLVLVCLLLFALISTFSDPPSLFFSFIDYFQSLHTSFEFNPRCIFFPPKMLFLPHSLQQIESCILA